MAQTGYTPISIYYSATATNVPTAGNLVAGELAINTADGKLFYKDSAGVVQVIAGKGGAGVAGGSNTQVQYNSSGSLAGSANMVFDGSTLTTLNSAYTGTLTGGTGVVNLGSGQFYKDSSGNVGIGTASPGHKLQVAGAICATGQFANPSANTISIDVVSGSSTRIINTGQSTTVYNPILFSQVYSDGSGYTERMRINTNGNIVLQGGTQAASGIGITFPASQSASSDANCLDDYEEGSWTPTVGGNATYAVQAGKYVKIGQSVICWFDIAITTLGTGSSTSFSGFPFTSISQSNPQGMGGSVGYFATASTAVSSIFIRIDPASTGVSIAATVGNLTAVGTYAIFQNGTRFTGTITYQTNA